VLNCSPSRSSAYRHLPAPSKPPSTTLSITSPLTNSIPDLPLPLPVVRQSASNGCQLPRITTLDAELETTSNGQCPAISASNSHTTYRAQREAHREGLSSLHMYKTQTSSAQAQATSVSNITGGIHQAGVKRLGLSVAELLCTSEASLEGHERNEKAKATSTTTHGYHQ
jgi:hypothetical protein